MNDFLNGWSSGMTGSGGGLPSQSVLEKMGRDAASNQWNNNNQARHGGGGSTYDRDHDNTIPVTTVIYQKSKQIRFKKLVRDFAIAFGLICVSVLVAALTPRSLDWMAELIGIPGWLWGMWAMFRVPFFLLGRLGCLLEGKKKEAE